MVAELPLSIYVWSMMVHQYGYHFYISISSPQASSWKLGTRTASWRRRSQVEDGRSRCVLGA